MSTLSQSVRQFFAEDGQLSSLPGYEFRPQQLEMAAAISDALEQRRHLIVEAPTGVGKSLAYLVPAILFARLESRKAIVSTHTKNLQDQLLNNDLAIVRDLLGRPFDAVAFKGRGNYLCTTRLANALHQHRRLFDDDEFEQLQRMSEWAGRTSTGDIDSMPFRPSPGVWRQVCSEQGVCSSTLCGPGCFFQNARKRARAADLVIMNHALFFALFAMQDSEEFFLFKNDFVILDEAHTLEQVAGTGIGKSISRAQVLFAIHRLFNDKSKKGLLSRVRAKRHRQLCSDAVRAANSFFDNVEQAVSHLRGKSGSLRVRTPYFVDDTVTTSLKDLQMSIKELEEKAVLEGSKEELAATGRLLWEAETLIREFLEQPEASFTYWIEVSKGRQSNVILCAAPTSIAESVGSKLFREGTSVIMTSATLSVGGTLDYFRQRIGAIDAKTLVLDSPFDYRRQMRIVLAKDLPSPDEKEYEEALSEALFQSIIRSKGKALVLFTNSALMQAMAGQLRERIEGQGLTLLVQEGTTGRHRLLEQFKNDIHSVLFGLDSFWMGVDVPGEALEHVIITKLPFAVPDHPLTEARLESIAQRGGNSFAEYTLPEAILKLKQGAGRLIRAKTDKGVITILDSRLVRKQYGRAFVQSLPRCPTEILSADGTSEEVEMEW